MVNNGSTSLTTSRNYKTQRELADKITAHAQLDDIRILLASGAQVNEPVVQGLRPLHYAVYANNWECVRLLLVRGANINAVDEVGYSALHLCSERGFFDLLVYLIDNRAKTCFIRKDDSNPYPISYNSEEPLRLAIRNGHFDCARLLLENGADPNARYFLGTEINLITPNDTKFLKLLLMYGADANSYDRDGLTPLMKAARHRDGLESVQILFEYGALINAFALERQDFRTPLHYAILSGNVKIVAYLIENGAFVNMQWDYNKPSPLDFAVLRDQVDIIDLLLSQGADPNSSQTYIGTSLHLACCSDLTNQHQIINLLLKSDADPNITPIFDDAHLKSPFIEYFRTRSDFSLQTVKLFLFYGAKVIMKSPVVDANGILRSLAKIDRSDSGESKKIYNLLLEAGQDFEAKSIDRSALSFDRRMELLNLATNPLSLKHSCRLTLRACLKPMRPEKTLKLTLPMILQRYLIYDD